MTKYFLRPTDDHDIKLDSLEVDTSAFDNNSDIAPLIVNIPKRKCSSQGAGHRAKISSLQQSSRDNHGQYSKMPVNVVESELILKPSTISTRLATHGSTVESELVVGFNLEEKSEVKTEDEAVNNEKKDFRSSVLAEKVNITYKGLHTTLFNVGTR